MRDRKDDRGQSHESQVGGRDKFVEMEIELSHCNQLVFFQVTQREERLPARRAHGVPGQRGVNEVSVLEHMSHPESWAT